YGRSTYGGSTYGGSSWGQPGYADSGIRSDSRVQGQSYRSAPLAQDGSAQSGESRPQALPQGERTMSARPDLEGGVPPAPGDNAAADESRDGQLRGDTQQQTEQMRQRIQTLEQENERLKQQLEEARSDENSTSADRAGQPSAEADAEPTSDSEAADLPA